MYQKVLVTLDGSEAAEVILPHVEAIVKGCAVPEVWLLRVVEPIRVWEGMTAEMVYKGYEEMEQTARGYLQKVAQGLQGQGIKVETAITRGPAAEEIVDFAEKKGIALIIMATHGRSGISRFIFGSVATKVLRGAKMPILLVRAK